MIRPTTANDTEAILDLAVAALGFESDELKELQSSLSQSLSPSSKQSSVNQSTPFWLTDELEGKLVGAAYCEPERMTCGTWNLLFIAVEPAHQGQGQGKAMMQFVEQKLMEQGDRLLLVETLASFEDSRAFYRHCGYEEEACIRDYYDAGQDKVVYRKRLTT